MGKSRSFLSIAVPSGTVFLSRLAHALAIQGRYGEAIVELQNAIGFMSKIGNEKAVGQLKKLLELKKSNQKK